MAAHRPRKGILREASLCEYSEQLTIEAGMFVLVSDGGNPLLPCKQNEGLHVKFCNGEIILSCLGLCNWIKALY